MQAWKAEIETKLTASRVVLNRPSIESEYQKFDHLGRADADWATSQPECSPLSTKTTIERGRSEKVAGNNTSRWAVIELINITFLERKDGYKSYNNRQHIRFPDESETASTRPFYRPRWWIWPEISLESCDCEKKDFTSRSSGIIVGRCLYVELLNAGTFGDSDKSRSGRKALNYFVSQNANVTEIPKLKVCLNDHFPAFGSDGNFFVDIDDDMVDSRFGDWVPGGRTRWILCVCTLRRLIGQVTSKSWHMQFTTTKLHLYVLHTPSIKSSYKTDFTSIDEGE